MQINDLEAQLITDHEAQIERSHMGKIERGEHLPNLVLILRLAKALSVKPGVLVDKAAVSLKHRDVLQKLG